MNVYIPVYIKNAVIYYNIVTIIYVIFYSFCCIYSFYASSQCAFRVATHLPYTVKATPYKLYLLRLV